MGKIELFINSLDLSEIVGSIVPEGSENFTVKLRRIGKAGRLSKQAQLYTGDNTIQGFARLLTRKGRIPIVVFSRTKAGEQYAFPDAYLTFEPGKIGVRKKMKPISFTANIGGGFAVPAEFREEMLRNIAQAGGVASTLIGQPVRIPLPRHLNGHFVADDNAEDAGPAPRARHDDAAEAARIAWGGVAPYSVGMDAARADADVTAFARRFADATGRSAADVERDIQNVINLETSRAFTEGVQARIDLTLFEGDEAEDDGE